MTAMGIDTAAVDEAVLARLRLRLHGQNHAWKSFDWDVLNRLYEPGMIGNPVNNAKSVVLTEEGLRESECLFNQLFPSPSQAAKIGN
ncbi:hypothetical protein BPMI_02206 [Candidatus Burkholderia pumila]|uniref:DUF6429 domain-containing protein n=1 Tax=Candidatus Burkholderia pumila TaxID=1090375 RepID=A0ABR5HLP7_9BURK|nr:hypothetical protein BPMI_02206 [Candidatus Burkholderia pumila]